MIGKKYIQALKIIFDKLSDKDISWAVYGSFSLILRSFSFEAHDIDILTNKAGVFAANDALQEYAVKPIYLNERYNTYIAEFCINDIKVEVKGPFHGNETVSYTFLQPDFIELEGIHIPTISIHNQIEAYKICNREKDRVKIKKIQELIGCYGKEIL